MDNFRFADGTVLTAADIGGRAEILPITGTEGNDNLTGVAVYDHNNTIYGLGGNDTITGGTYGNDILDGGSGNDVRRRVTTATVPCLAGMVTTL